MDMISRIISKGSVPLCHFWDLQPLPSSSKFFRELRRDPLLSFCFQTISFNNDGP